MKTPINHHVCTILERACTFAFSPTGGFSGAAILALALGLPTLAQAQSDNFDSGTLSSAWTKYQFFGQSYTFPDSGTGKALRIQANPVPNAAPAAAAIAQTNIYTDFYVAVDLVAWVVNNQAVVLLGRWTPGGTAGLAEGTGIIMNYDAAQDGDAGGDRKGGQLQINNVFPGFAAATLAATEVSLEPGRSYRFILRGVGTAYSGAVYDHADLTKPVATVFADDTTYTTGLCGFLSYSRNGTTGTTDVTIDNYYAGASDPNPAPAPVLAHPVPGTPIVSSRVPAARWQNFFNPAAGISFTADTYAVDVINAAATKLYLNGVDVSSQLVLPANGSSISVSLPGTALQANTVYSGRIELSDTTGLKTSTHTFWFDTFSQAFLATSPIKTIEAEDYNYSNGVYQLDPVPISGRDTNGTLVNGSVDAGGNNLGYFGMAGTAGVDYAKPGGFYNLDLAEYRANDRVQITQGSYLSLSRDEAGDIQDFLTNQPPFRINDTQRSQYAISNVLEYQVRLTSPGDWMNYTRSFAATNYHVYLRCGSFGSTTVYLDQVTTDPSVARQEAIRHGAFNVGNHIMRLNYQYEQLMYGASPAVVQLGGTNTLRLTMGGVPTKDERVVVMDYLLLVPTSDTPTPVAQAYPPTVFDNFGDNNDTTPAWAHYDPLNGVTGGPATFAATGGVYHIIAPAPAAPDAGPARAGSFLAGGDYTDFYASVDVIDFDDTVRQAFGIAARITSPGLGTTDGYLFSWEPGGGVLPGTDNGDLDISILADEAPIGQIETNSSAFHLTKGKSYRFVFMGRGADLEGQVYELPDTTNPLIRLYANDPSALYPVGQVGVIVASQSDPAVTGNATFDNFLVTTAEPRLTVSQSGNSITLTWPTIPYRLQSSPSIASPVWTDVTTGNTFAGGVNVHTETAASAKYFRLVYP